MQELQRIAQGLNGVQLNIQYLGVDQNADQANVEITPANLVSPWGNTSQFTPQGNQVTESRLHMIIKECVEKVLNEKNIRDCKKK